MKAIEKDPERRYASAEAMAEDLRRYLDDETVRARRTTAVERYSRWARRNPGVAVLGGVLTAVLLLVTAGSLIVAGSMRRLAGEQTRAAFDAEVARQQEAVERALAEDRPTRPMSSAVAPRPTSSGPAAPSTTISPRSARPASSTSPVSSRCGSASSSRP